MNNIAAAFCIIVASVGTSDAMAGAVDAALRVKIELLAIGNPWVEHYVVDNYEIRGSTTLIAGGFRMTVFIDPRDPEEYTLWQFDVVKTSSAYALAGNMPGQSDITQFYMKSIFLREPLVTSDPEIYGPFMRLRRSESLTDEDRLTILRLVKWMADEVFIRNTEVSVTDTD